MDLVILAADQQIAASMEVLLSRPQALKISEITFESVVHPGKDPGVYSDPCRLLDGYRRDASRALVLLDCAWEGAPPGGKPAIESHVTGLFTLRGYGDWAAVVAIDPELEAWFWSSSPHSAGAIDWPDSSISDLRGWLQQQQLWGETDPKPADPKAALQAACRQSGVPLSAAVFRHVAEHASVRRCTDESFGKLRQTLTQWFPLEARP